MKPTQRTPAVPFDDIPGELPRVTVPKDLNLLEIEQWVVETLKCLQLSDLYPGTVWRDLVSFTGTYRTFTFADRVFEVFEKLRKERFCSAFALKGTPTRPSPFGWLDIDVVFSIRSGYLTGSGAGIISVLLDRDGKRKIWMLRTWLESFEGHGHPDELEPRGKVLEVDGHASGTIGSSVTVYDTVIVGGGQAGLSLAGRLQALGIKYLLLEKNTHIGDVWRNRYDSLSWHTAKEFGNLPFGRTYTVEDEYCVPTKRIGASHQSWSEKYGINAHTGTSVESANYDESPAIWTITGSTPRGVETFRAKRLILSTGPAHSVPKLPPWATPAAVKSSGYNGTLLHGSQYRSSLPWNGKRGMIGSMCTVLIDILVTSYSLPNKPGRTPLS
jgi:hypothetical protein